MQNLQSSANERIRLFTESFRSQDVARPLLSFDGDKSAAIVKDQLEQRHVEVAGVREMGSVVGFVHRSQLGSGCVRDFVQGFNDDAVVGDNDALALVVRKLREHDAVFVSVFGEVGGVITAQEMGRPALRMWLFGMITLMEMDFTRIIRLRFPAGEWQRIVSPGRLSKAVDLQDERHRRDEPCDLLDCLQFSDKAQILVKDNHIRNHLQFKSVSAAKQAVKELESLRNNLAHSQDIVRENWHTILVLVENMDDLMLRLANARAA